MSLHSPSQAFLWVYGKSQREVTTKVCLGVFVCRKSMEGRMCCVRLREIVRVWGKNGLMIFTNYNKLYVRPHMRFWGAISIMLWCNGISLVSCTPCLNVTLGCGSDPPHGGREPLVQGACWGWLMTHKMLSVTHNHHSGSPHHLFILWISRKHITCIDGRVYTQTHTDADRHTHTHTIEIHRLRFTRYSGTKKNQYVPIVLQNLYQHN